MPALLFRALTLVAAFLLSACVAPSDPDDDSKLPRYDLGFRDGDENQTITLTTDSPSLEITLDTSRARNDTYCARSVQHSPFIRLAGDRPFVTPLGFTQQGSPNVALYEWHVCLIYDGVVHRGWRGFDPGPGAELRVSCTISEEGRKTEYNGEYLCKADKVVLNPGNYTEYNNICDAGVRDEEECRRFDTKDEYEKWASLNPIPANELMQIAESVLQYSLSHKDTYLGANEADFEMYLSIDGKDPPADFLARISRGAIPFRRQSQLSRPDPLNFPAGKMKVSISKFEATEPGVAKGHIGAYCGSICGSGNTVIVRKVDGVWTVDSIKLDVIF